MVWNNAIYKKSWSISKPHYAVTIRLNLTYGDQYNGNFYYTIQGIKSVPHPKPSSGGQNFIGKNLNEITKYFEIFQSPFTSSSLDIEFQCTDTTADPRDQFCAISDYFIVVHYCLPFCQICNDGVSCVIWESGHTSQNCNTNQFLQFDSNSETYSCITCNQPGCLTCKNLEECTSCDFSKGLNNGVCFQCNKFCETCKGSLKTDCITCVSDFQRFIFNNQCQCLPGYYDDDINLPCHPVCGDLLVVDGEDCDDGNNNPFDGCHNCKYGCDAFCQECIQGVCYLCQNDLQIINNKCVGICGDNITSHDEQCDDGNIISFDGCFECQYQCQAECTDCKFGLCYDCSIKGWQLFNNYCIPYKFKKFYYIKQTIAKIVNMSKQMKNKSLNRTIIFLGKVNLQILQKQIR
ncbi:unnamed protein product [Paramecium pentaurelia]|uniref:Insulin-like growth factor binding protein, N-terminal n=1 Tax=Paramecium pentaurelia TaxID=43138 RepID=A0A8S1X3R9_9CILI|nr:unnamed protein product [Paramecium pentaurelia]